MIIGNPNKLYRVIYADPPWQYSNRTVPQGGTEKYYPTMPIKDILEMPIRRIVAKDAVLFLWGVWPLMAEALATIEAWGFELKTCAFVWVKTPQKSEVNQARLFLDESFTASVGCGYWTRSNSEFCLLGVRGKVKRCDASISQIIFSPRFRHSEKPAETRDRIVKLMGSDFSPRIELFARNRIDGWDAFGNQL